jgi:hypothetical protein
VAPPPPPPPPVVFEVVEKVEAEEDLSSWLVVCYDFMQSVKGNYYRQK